MDTRNPYKTPEGYFEKLNARILSQTTELGDDHKLFVPKREKEKQHHYTVKSMMGFAAGFAIFVALAWGGFYLMVGSSDMATLSGGGEYYAEEFYGLDDAVLYDAMLGVEDYSDDLFADAAEDYLSLYSMADLDLLYE